MIYFPIKRKKRSGWRRLVFAGVEILSSIAAIIVVLMLVLIWRLSQGPVSLHFMQDSLLTFLHRSESGMTAALENSFLIWDRNNHEVALELQNLKLMKVDIANEIEETSLFLPRVYLKHSVSQFFKGRFLPSRVAIFEPSLTIIRDKEGNVWFGAGHIDADKMNPAKDKGNMTDFFTKLATLIGPGGKYDYIQDIAIQQASLNFDDQLREQSWVSDETDLMIKRRGDRLSIDSDLRLLSHEIAIPMTLKADYDFVDTAGEMSFQFINANLAQLVPLLSPFSDLPVKDVPVSGIVKTTIAPGTNLSTLSFDFLSEEGLVDLTRYDYIPLAYHGAEIQGSLDFQKREVQIDKFSFTIGKTETPVTIMLSGTILQHDSYNTQTGMRMNLAANLQNMAMQDLPQYWPEALAPNPRRWVVKNILEGHVTNVNMNLDLFAPAQKMADAEILDVKGQIDFEKGRVSYIEGMTPVEDVKGMATFGENWFTIKIDQGTARNIQLTDALVELTDLEKGRGEQWADITLTTEGAMPNLLRLLNEAPLHYADRFGVSPDQVDGTAIVTAKLRLPLIDNLSLDTIAVESKSSLSKIYWRDVYEKLSLQNGQFDLMVNNRKFDMRGQAQIGRYTKELSWEEYFDKADYQDNFYRRLHIKGVTDDQDIEKAGFDFGSYINGEAILDLTLLEKNKEKASFSIDADLTRASLVIDDLSWVKPSGAAAKLSTKGALSKGKLSTFDSVSFQSDDFRFQGKAGFAADGKLQSLDLAPFKLGKSDLQIAAQKISGVYQTKISGSALDASPFFEGPKGQDEPLGWPLHLDLDVKTMNLVKDRPLYDVKINAKNDGKVWQEFALNAALPNQGQWRVKTTPQGTGRQLIMQSNNAGALLYALDLHDHVKGGTILINGQSDDQNDMRPFQLQLQMKDFSLEKAPVLARILGLASLTGILDSLTGQGIVFNTADAEMVWGHEELNVKTFEAFGPSIGILTNGIINLKTDELNLKGELIPVYALSSFVSEIPILGPLLTGTEGQGIFAAQYTVKGDMKKPAVAVNPLTSIAPGILRDFLKALGADSEVPQSSEQGQEATP